MNNFMRHSCFAVFLLFVAGCQTSSETHDSNRVFESTADRTITLEALTAQQAYTPTESAKTYSLRIESKTHTAMRTVTPADRFDAQWKTIESVLRENKQQPRRTLFWSIDQQNRAVLHASIDHKEKAISLFDPPLVLLPARLTLGDRHTFQSDIRIVSEHDPSRTKEHGAATQTIAYTTNALVQTPFGEQPTAKVDITFAADLSLAEAEERTELYIAPTAGIIAIHRARDVKILGFPGNRTTETLLLMEE